MQGLINALEFHPTARALFTAGLDRNLRIFQVRWLSVECNL
jgi:hypothetical protein